MLLLQNACRRTQTVLVTAKYLRGSTIEPRWLQKQHRQASTDLGAEAITTVVTTLTKKSGLLGFWHSLSTSRPVGIMQDALVMIHDGTGLPWWASIALTTVAFRSIVTLPLTIYQQKITARIEKIALEMPAIVDELKREAAVAKHKFHWSEKQTQIVYRRSVCPKTCIHTRSIHIYLILFSITD